METNRSQQPNTEMNTSQMNNGVYVDQMENRKEDSNEVPNTKMSQMPNVGQANQMENKEEENQKKTKEEKQKENKEEEENILENKEVNHVENKLGTTQMENTGDMKQTTSTEEDMNHNEKKSNVEQVSDKEGHLEKVSVEEDITEMLNIEKDKNEVPKKDEYKNHVRNSNEISHTDQEECINKDVLQVNKNPIVEVYINKMDDDIKEMESIVDRNICALDDTDSPPVKQAVIHKIEASTESIASEEENLDILTDNDKLTNEDINRVSNNEAIIITMDTSDSANLATYSEHNSLQDASSSMKSEVPSISIQENDLEDIPLKDEGSEAERSSSYISEATIIIKEPKATSSVEQLASEDGAKCADTRCAMCGTCLEKSCQCICYCCAFVYILCEWALCWHWCKKQK